MSVRVAATAHGTPCAHVQVRFACTADGDWMGSGIFVTDGQEWSKRREFAKVLFHSSSLRSHVPVFTRAARQLCARFRALAQQGPVDVQVRTPWWCPTATA